MYSERVQLTNIKVYSVPVEPPQNGRIRFDQLPPQNSRTTWSFVLCFIFECTTAVPAVSGKNHGNAAGKDARQVIAISTDEQRHNGSESK